MTSDTADIPDFSWANVDKQARFRLLTPGFSLKIWFLNMMNFRVLKYRFFYMK